MNHQPIAPATPPDGDPWAALACAAGPPKPAELGAVLALWREAQTRGWAVNPDPETRSWRASDPAGTAAMAYDSPGLACIGVVTAHDARRTLVLTGVPDAAEAVAQIRAFLGWDANPALVATAVHR